MKRLLMLPLFGLTLLTACGDDSDSVTGPTGEIPPTHFEVSLQMSSIWAQNDCENTPGNPGDFRWRLIVRKPDELGNEVIVHDTGSRSVTISDGDRVGITMDPVRFLVPNSPDSEFEVEYWVGEYDPAADFERHSWSKHTLGRREDQMWASGVRAYESDRYTENEDGSGSGLYKFAVWNTRAECSGAAYYYVTWTPVTPEPAPNQSPTVARPVTATFHELDSSATVDLLNGANDPDGDPLDATNIRLVSGDDRGVSVRNDGNTLGIEPAAYAALDAGQSTVVSFEYDIEDGRGASVRQLATIIINGG